MAALADQHVRIVGDDIVLPALAMLAGYYFNGADFTQGQLSSPSLREVLLIDVEPADVLAEPSSRPPFHDLMEKPIQLDATEALNALMAEDGAGASRVNALAWLSDGPTAPVSGDMRTLRATGTTTLVAFAWSNVALTLTQTLPAGDYQVVGLRAQSAGCIAARLVFPGGTWRPGVIGFDADGDVDEMRFRNGNAGVFGTFAHDAPPTIDFLSVSADTAEVIHLDLIKV
jgi:hypothetical protein